MTGWDNVGAELRAAVGLITAAHGLARTARREALAGGLAFLPLVGLGVGAVAALAATLVARWLPPVAGLVGVAVLMALTSLRPVLAVAVVAEALLVPGPAATVLGRLRAGPGVAGAAVATAMVGLKTWAAILLPPSMRTWALVFAPMLGAWAVTVQCYGGSPVLARGVAAALVGRARFREFGLASLCALGVVLVAADAVGLMVAIVAAMLTVGVRLYVHHRVGGLTGRCLLATRELVETAVLVVLALLARPSRL